MRSVVILSAVAATLAASVSYASETLACSGNDCCSLNGEYAGTSCTCYPPWTGPACATLDVAPVQAPYQGYGMSPNVTSWGGNVIEVGGVYHMYVAEMVNNCSLNAWGSNSRCSHAVSSSIEGPYVYVAPAVDVWCHNPQVIATQNASGPLYVLFHIGSGAGGNPKNCNVSRADVDGPSGWAGDAPQAATARSMRGVAGGDAAGGSSLHVATSPYGPWVPVQPAPPSCNNPAPFLHPNGTWYLVCSGFTMYSSPSITGPWATVLKNINPAGKGVGGTYEDPFLYVDARGNWHLLFHVVSADDMRAAGRAGRGCGSLPPANHRGVAWPVPPYNQEFSDCDQRLTNSRTTSHAYSCKRSIPWTSRLPASTRPSPGTGSPPTASPGPPRPRLPSVTTSPSPMAAP